MKRDRPFFPITLSTSSTAEKLDSFQNEVIGGVSVRDVMAMEFMKALLSNPAYVGAKHGITGEAFSMATLRRIAIGEADSFIAMLGEE